MMVRASLIAFFLLPAGLRAQAAGADVWTLRLSAVISSASYESDPAGYEIYSGLSLEAGFARWLNDVVSVELSARTESREVNGPSSSGSPDRLGSIELVPLNLIASWHPLAQSGRRVQPVVGAGVSFTGIWEKSGALDSSASDSVWSPVLQGSTDIRLSDRSVLKLQAGWQLLTIEIRDFAPTSPRVDIDPLIVGVGVEVGL